MSNDFIKMENAGPAAKSGGDGPDNSDLFDTPGNPSISIFRKAENIVNKLRFNTTYCVKVIYSVCLIYSYALLGWTSGQLGPVLLDLEQITNVSLELASTYILAIGLGYIVGSFLGGVIYDKMSRPVIMFFALLCLTIMEISIPWCKMYGLMLFVLFVDGVFEGIVDTVTNTEIVNIWGKSVESWMQAMYFMFAMGAVVSPLATAPFLSPETPSDMHHKGDNLISVDGSSMHFENSHLYKAYLINGILMFTSSILYLIIVIKYSLLIGKINAPKETLEQLRPLSTKSKILVLINMGGLCLFYTALEETFSEYLVTFAVKQLSMTKVKGSEATSLFYAAFGIARFSGIFLVNVFNPIRLVCAYCSGLIFILGGLTISGGYFSEIGLWIFAPLVGVGLSVIYPIIYTWTDEHFLTITGKISAWFVIAASIGGMVNPVILGYLMEERSPMWFCYLLLIESLCLLILYVLGLLIELNLEEPNIERLESDIKPRQPSMRRRSTRKSIRSISGSGLARQDSSAVDEDGMYTIQLKSPKAVTGNVFKF